MRPSIFSLKRAANAVPMGTGATFVVVLTILIIFYLIFLPPADRAALLNTGTIPDTGDASGTSGTGSSGTATGNGFSAPVFGTMTVFEQSFSGPGKLVRVPQSNYAHDISTTTLRGAYQATVLLTANDFIASRSALSNKIATFSFALDSPKDVKNGLLTFGVKNYATAQGFLTIKLNGVEIFSGTFSQFNSDPINLGAAPMQQINTLTFEVTAPGIAFWRSNEYEITGLKVQADVIARDGLSSSDSFTVDPVETQHLSSVRLRFVPSCGTDTGKLTITINNATVFAKIPDCGSANYVTVPNSALVPEQNNITFTSDYGLYQLDQIEVQTFLTSDDGTSYFFDLDKDWFTTTDTKDPVCGESDGVCPAGCSADVDSDCCYTAYQQAFWCSTPTPVTADRCVGYVDNLTAGRCSSGYKDSNGDVASVFSNSHVCGDNNDGICPSGCSSDYDKDCCLAPLISNGTSSSILPANAGNYYCDELTTGGVGNMCMLSLSTEEAAFCPDGYLSRNGGRLASTFNFGTTNLGTSVGTATQESVIDSDYIVTAEFDFVDDSNYHSAELLINGFKTNFDTRDPRILMDISKFSVAQSNYIQIIPQSDFSLVRVTVKVEKR